jgi:leucyl aminopeptidase
MEFMAIVDAKAHTPAGCAVVGVYENAELGLAARQVDKQLAGMITNLLGSGDFAAKLGDSLMLPSPAGSAASRLLLIGLGTRAGFGRKQYRKALQASAQALAKTGAADAVVYLAMEPVSELDTQYRARMVSEVFSSQAYRIPDLKTSPKPKARRLASVNVATADARAAKAATEGLRIGAAIGSGLALARDLANLPPNVCTPTYIGNRALQLAKEFPSIKTKVLDESGIKALKMGAFLAVTQGSKEPPRLIVCEYRGTYASWARALPLIRAAFRSRIPPPWTK